MTQRICTGGLSNKTSWNEYKNKVLELNDPIHSPIIMYIYIMYIYIHMYTLFFFKEIAIVHSLNILGVTRKHN